MNLPPYFMVFDVESIGLHGEGFAVGWVVIEPVSGTEINHGIIIANPLAAKGTDEGRQWCRENIPHPVYDETVDGEGIWLREQFWSEWLNWKDVGAILVADCAWPVEARFLAACVDDEHNKREWQGPYPLHDLATFRLAAGLDPLATTDRLPDELPVHDPLADARQSARLLLEAIELIHEPSPPVINSKMDSE